MQEYNAFADVTLSGIGKDIRILDSQAKAEWPANFLMSIFGWSKMVATALLETCPETLGDIAYIMDHISKSKPAYAVMLYEYYRDHMTITGIAARHKMRQEDLQRKLVGIVSCVRNSHLPSIISVGLSEWKRKQNSVKNEDYPSQRNEPLTLLESFGVLELAVLSDQGCVTIGDFVDLLHDGSGIPLDGRYITEDIARSAYDELDMLHVLSRAWDCGIWDLDFRVQTIHAKESAGRARTRMAAEWPMNLWNAVVTDEDAMPPDDLSDSIISAVGKLSQKQRECLFAVYRDGMTCKEYAYSIRANASAIHSLKRAAVDMCRMPHIERLFLIGQEECKRQERDFRLSTVKEMRSYPASILSTQSWRATRTISSTDTVGALIDRLLTESAGVGRSGKQNAELAAIYQALLTAGVVRRCWDEGMEIRNPMCLVEVPVPLMRFLTDLWGRPDLESGPDWSDQVPEDILYRLDYALTTVLQSDERECLVANYPVLECETLEDVLHVDNNLTADKMLVNPCMEKLRSSIVLTRPAGRIRARGRWPVSYSWPDNLLLRIFKCTSLNDLQRYIPEKPSDLEHAIDYIFETKMSYQTAAIMRAYFKDGETCRGAGKKFGVSGAYVGSVISSTIENLLRSEDVRRYLQAGYAEAKKVEERRRALGVTEAMMQRTVDEFPFKPRIANAFQRAGVQKLEDVVSVLCDSWHGGVAGLGVRGRASAYDTLNELGVVEYYQRKGKAIPPPAGREGRQSGRQGAGHAVRMAVAE